jgi:hypothetical protein
VPPTGEDPGEPFLLAAALKIEDNVLFCTRQAVALNGSVLHVTSTHIVRNEVFGGVEVAISALGLGAPASATVISANTLVVPGNGIRCGLGGAWIEGRSRCETQDGSDCRRTMRNWRAAMLASKNPVLGGASNFGEFTTDRTSVSQACHSPKRDCLRLEPLNRVR